MPFADELLGVDAARTLTRSLRQAAPGNPFTAVGAASEDLGERPLRERADLLRNAILTDVPGDFGSLARIVRSAAASGPSFAGWLIWPVAGAVASRAISDGDTTSFDDAMRLQAELTGRLTAEFTIRALLQHDLDRAMPIVLSWTTSDDEHVRRLASEGTRPFLPWAIRVKAMLARPRITIPILDALYRDESEYVRRSVANHLNDLSRDHPELVLETVGRWLEAASPETPALVKHALRTLVKRGHPGALAVLGFTPTATTIESFTIDTTDVAFGGSVSFSATVRNTDALPARLAIDYVVTHQKANGTQTAKTFKLTTQALAPGEHVQIARAHSFRAITTRRYHPGAHAVALQVNGVLSEPLAFELLPPVSSPSSRVPGYSPSWLGEHGSSINSLDDPAH